jgi:hypothetical protein
MTKSNNHHYLTVMKSLIVISLTGSLAVATAAPPMRDAATHEQLSLAYRKASQQDPMRKQAPAKGPDPSTATPPTNLIADSDVICFNGNVALVPKRAIIQIPKNYEDRLKYQPGAKLMGWTEFYSLNRGWITTVEVSRGQAAGTIPIADETRKQISKSGNLIIGTYQGGPISVLPPKAPAETTPKTPAETASKTAAETTTKTPKP